MSREPLIVLKFGGSVLASEQELPSAIHEIYRWVARGYRVVSVVSALGTTTNRLLEQSRGYGHRLNPSTVAKLAATGEAASSALLGLALDRVGIANEVHDETSLGFETRGGQPLDSELLKVDGQKFDQAFERVRVIVVPGFIGRCPDDKLELLGRGGSDLTALFLAQAIEAEQCRLVKDVDGLFEWDPKRSGSPRQYDQIKFEHALQLDEKIVQHKAVRFARDHSINFEVGSLRNSEATSVGQYEHDQFHDQGLFPEPLRVALLGLGTVGLGVYEHACQFPSIRFTGIAVRDVYKAESNGAPAELITNDPIEAIQADTDLVIELIGGIEPALTLVRSALNSGKHVITANKSLMARHGEELLAIAESRNAKLCYSAAVGGGVPMTETVRRISQIESVESLEGVLNGTCNFVLDKVANQVSFADAVLAAQREGFAEADPSRDLDGTDAAEKLVILAREMGIQLNFKQVGREPLAEAKIEDWLRHRGQNEVLRQVSSLARQDNDWQAKVELKPLSTSHPFAQTHGEDNRLDLLTAAGSCHRLRGRGAGRYPTSQAVVNDLSELVRELRFLRQRERQSVSG